MQRLLAISRAIDGLNERIGRAAAWAILAAAVISAANAVLRKLDLSSNAWLEIQWWLFAVTFLLAAPWTLARNEHIRIDVVSNRLSQRARDIIDIVGHSVFLLPIAALILVTSWSYFVVSWTQNEGSPNAGGLPLWPVKALIPIAFALLFLQALSELIKRIAIMRGDCTEPPVHDGRHNSESSGA
jgi:TRAP-type mannitol/chloroaromatic compound transport system permease small subunit